MTATHPITDSRVLAARAFVAQRPTLFAAVACLLSFTGFWLAQRAVHVSMIDLMVYRAEGQAVRDGADLYAMRATWANLPNTYPPFAALMFTPLTWLDVDTMRTCSTVLNLALLVGLVHLSLRLIGRPYRLPRAAAALALSALAVWCEPVWTTLRYGQVNLLLAVLVLWDLTRRADQRWAGVGIGIAAGMKLTPALFAVFLALAGLAGGWRALRAGESGWNPQLRKAAVATATFGGTVALAALALPYDSRRFWTETLFATDRVGRIEDTANQSVRGILARALHTTDPGLWWLVAAALVAGAGLAVAVAAQLAGDRLPSGAAWAAVTCATTALMVSPVSWSHHWVWAVPMVLLLGSEALRRKEALWVSWTAATWLLFCSFLLWLVPHDNQPWRAELHQNAAQMAFSGIYPAVGAVFLAVAGLQTVRALRARSDGAPPAIPAQARAASPGYSYADR